MVLLLMVPALSSAGSIYKCKGAGAFDSVVWQNEPCNAGEEVSHQKMHDYSAHDASKAGHGTLTAAEVSKLIRFKQLAIGMSKKDVIRSWGQPTKTDIMLSNTGKSETLIYAQYKNTPIVSMSLQNIVSNIQYSTTIEKEVKPVRTFNYSGGGPFSK
ncbi:MAG: hypothetical protein Q9M17_02595 [Mariprofundus sp.]|nr:hypothetical protein [Mariprofundus sp.]